MEGSGGGVAPLCHHGRVSPVDRTHPIAVFDSGVGGLTVLHECLVWLPHEDFVYLGDTARFPYGGRAPGDEDADRLRLLDLDARLREERERLVEDARDGGGVQDLEPGSHRHAP